MSERFQSRYPDAASSPGLALWHVANAWQRTMRAALSPHDLTHTQIVLLAMLTATAPDQLVTQRDLAGAAGTDEMMTSNVLRALESKKLIQRSPHPKDGRAVALTPTSAGINLVRKANHDVESADETYFAALDEPQRASLLNALHLLRNRSPEPDHSVGTSA